MKILLIISFLFIVPHCFGFPNEIVKRKPTPDVIYIDASQDTYPRLLPFYEQLNAAHSTGDQKTEKENYFKIVLMASAFDVWSWRFYQYGLANPEALDPNTKDLWQHVAEKFKDRKDEPQPEDMTAKSADEIIQGILQERNFVDHFLSSRNMRNGYKEHHPEFYQASSPLIPSATNSTPSPKKDKDIQTAPSLSPSQEKEIAPATTQSSTSESLKSEVTINVPQPLKPSRSWSLITNIAIAVLIGGTLVWKYLRKQP